MIGRIQFIANGEPAEVTLDDDGRWSSPDPFKAHVLGAVLTDAISSYVNLSPGRVRRPVLERHLREVAAMVRGTVEIEP